MADKLGLDNDVHELKIGSSFAGGPVGYHSIRYDFKPASVDTTQVANVEIGEGNSVTVTVPHVEGAGTSHTVYKGNKKPCQKECVLIIDHQTGEITLEKLATGIQLKKTSKLCSSVDPEDERSMWKGHGSSLKNVPIKLAESVFCDRGKCRARHEQSREKSTHAISKDERSKEHTNNLRYSHVAETFKRLELSKSPLVPGTTSKMPDKSTMKSDTKCRSLVQFSDHIRDDIKAYLRSHRMEKNRKPYVSQALSPEKFRRLHPELYKKAKTISLVRDSDLDALNQHLFTNFSSYLVDSSNVYGCVQRLEDLIEFIVTKYVLAKQIE